MSPLSKMSVVRDSSDDEGPAIPLEDARTGNEEESFMLRNSDEETGLIRGSSNAFPTNRHVNHGWKDVLRKIKCASGPSKGAKHASSTRACRRLGFIIVAFMMCLGVLQLVNILHGAYIALFPGHRNQVITEWEQIGKTGEGLKHYPTDFTRDILPISCHSHNDYWRALPLYSGISAGCISTEADVWLYGSDLLVGHDESSLTRNRTLQSLYINPLLEILDRENPKTEFADGSQTMNGVFDTDVNQVFTLLIDLKTGANQTFDAVVKALEPLRQKGYLSHSESSGKVIDRPLRVIGTGNTQFSNVLSESQNPHKDIFFDAPVDGMPTSTQMSDTVPSRAHADYSLSNSYYASGSFADIFGFVWGWSLTSAQLEKLRAQIKSAHERGLKVRYYETPAWPVSRRNALWSTLVEEGADILNVDDLKGAVEEDWRRSGRWWS